MLAVLFLTQPLRAQSQQARIDTPVPERYDGVQTTDDASIEDLIKQRIEKEWNTVGISRFKPELLRTEADYARLSATSRDVLYEASFHLQPHYYTRASTGPDTNFHRYAEQPIMYYVGSARTPLALPVVSNLSKTLSGDEASYTLHIGVLPLPDYTNPDSMRYYIVIERVIESNHTDNSVRLERFAKEFSAKIDDPVFLRLANDPLAKGAYIVRMENGSVLDFYDDFSRFIEEHIILKSDKLSFQLGHETISDVSERLSIPYSVAQTCESKVELLSVVDTAHPYTIVDTVREPADYLAEVDMSKFADGPYRYRYTAIDPESGKVLYTETHEFHKAAPITVTNGSRIGPGDTLEVGGKKKDWAGLLNQTVQELVQERVINDRISSTLSESEKEKNRLEAIVLANKKSSIADVHARAGFGIGPSSGDNFFIGIESNHPSLAFDVSFGWLYGGSNYLSYTKPQNFSQIFKSPSSLGFQLTWIPVKYWDGFVEPLLGVANYDEWSQPATPAGTSSVALLGWEVGVATEPWGEVHGAAFSVSYGAAYPLGISSGSTSGISVKANVRF